MDLYEGGVRIVDVSVDRSVYHPVAGACLTLGSVVHQPRLKILYLYSRQHLRHGSSSSGIPTQWSRLPPSRYGLGHSNGVAAVGTARRGTCSRLPQSPTWSARVSAVCRSRRACLASPDPT